ncbi:MAG: 3,4-dihydroxy-2-butanone-4-phosphate synthase [Candidatus Micrarchaeia archaeon]|jgi:3,4-dihydroxy 2-butanone 4-phosphate synthase
MDNVELALSALRKGGFVVLFDSGDREGEADILLGARFATPAKVADIRTFGGGLVCVAIGSEACDSLGLPFLAEVMGDSRKVSKQLILKKAKYGDKSAFSLSVNHKDTFTGIPDIDRAKTMRELGLIVEKAGTRGSSLASSFAKSFKAPGHVQLLRSSGLCNRKGHTELSTEMALLAGIAPAVVLCEILDGKTGRAASTSKAKAIAKKLHAPFISGKQVMEALE